MALTNFFKINLPYGIKRNENGSWTAFNREYKPLGENNSTKHFPESEYSYTNYGKLSDKFLVDLAGKQGSVHRDEKNTIVKIFFYNDATNPSNHTRPEFWDQYFEKVKMISTKKVK